MPKARLTALAVDRCKPPATGQIEYFDTHLPAFGLRVSYSGTKAWIVMTRVHGKLTLYRPRFVRHRIGSYAASTAGESWFCRTAAGVWNPYHRSVFQAAQRGGGATRR